MNFPLYILLRDLLVHVIIYHCDKWLLQQLYHKTLKGIETIIYVQRMVKDIKRMAEEANTMITEIEELVLMASINNRTTNTTNIVQILEDLQYLVQSNMDK